MSRVTSRDADDGLFDGFAEGGLCEYFDFFENGGADFGGAEAVVADDEPGHAVFGGNGGIGERWQEVLDALRIESLAE